MTANAVKTVYLQWKDPATKLTDSVGMDVILDGLGVNAMTIAAITVKGMSVTETPDFASPVVLMGLKDPCVCKVYHCCLYFILRSIIDMFKQCKRTKCIYMTV